jgi:polar amino acid transport system permease protein
MFDWAYAAACLPDLLGALRVTLLATLLGMALALTLGLAWALLRRAPWRAVAWPVGFAVEFLRSTPLLVQLYFLYFLLPEYGLRASAMTTGVLALGLHYSAYTAEVYRAGIDGVARGQWDAATALGLPRRIIWTRVVLPQALRPAIPALGNYLVAMFKDTPLLSAITVVELLQTGKILGAQHFRYLEPVTLVGALFLLLSLAAAFAVGRIERHLRPQGH